MADPISVLELGPVAPDLMTSAFGPFVETPVERLDEVASALDEQAYDAIVLNVDSPSVLSEWTGLPRAVLDAAVVMVAPEPQAADALRMPSIEDVLPHAVASLRSGGRLAVISFHSLEDRIVKDFFREQSKELQNPPYERIYEVERNAVVKEVNRKPIVPSEEETKNNPRASSAKLRIVEKL